MKIKPHLILLLILLSGITGFAQKPRSTEHFIQIQPLSIADRHFGWGLGAGYDLVAGKKWKYGLSFPLNYYHGIFAQIGKPAALYPGVKSRYATFSPTFQLFPVYKSRISYGIGIGLQMMYAYGTRAVRAAGIDPSPEYIPEHYKSFRFGGFVHNQFAVRMGKGNNRFSIDLGLGAPFYDQLPGSNSSVIVRFNLGFAFAL